METTTQLDPKDCQPSYAQVNKGRIVNVETYDNRRKVRVIPIDWNAKLSYLESNPGDEAAWSRALIYSECWVTCACGNQCDIIPRSSSGNPVDPILSILGGQFYRTIITRDIHGAYTILASIEERAIKIIKGIYAQQNYNAAR